MHTCANCKARMDDASLFCQNCGQPSGRAAVNYAMSPYPASSSEASFSGASSLGASSFGAPSYPAPLYAPQHLHAAAAGAKGLGQIFGLDPRIAFVMLIVDLMLNTAAVVSLGLLVPFSIVAGMVLGLVTYKAQISWYRDDRESALIKALIVALLTAIPTPLPAFLYVPSGVVGLVHLIRRKSGG